MLQVSNLRKLYGDDVILDCVSFTVNSGDQLGIVGPNGCGKTTLLRIIAGVEQPDQGSVRLSPPGLMVGYLAQALEFELGSTVGALMRQSDAALYAAEKLISTLTERIVTAEGDALKMLLEKYADATARFEAAGGYAAGHQVEAILAGLGLDAVELDSPIEYLSGGQKTRLGLACLLMTQSPLLLLDEPTNHLDMEAVDWLEDFLLGYDGALIVVSHDRTFLDSTVNAILEIDPLTHTASVYSGNYSDYAQAKQSEIGKRRAAYNDQQDRIERIERAARGLSGHAQRIEQTTVHYHYRKVAKGLARQSVVQRKRLERLIESEDLIDKPERSWEMKLDFGPVPPSGKDVLMLEGLSMGYDDAPLFSEVNLTLTYGEKVALVGPNGCGKTTLLRGIVDRVQPLAGIIRLGANVRLGYYSQEQEGLDDSLNPLEEILGVAAMSETEVRRFLHLYLFAGDEVFVPVGNLSFGERNRLALAKLVASGCNFLLLDEPINHLDISSRERFEQGLSAFDGTVLAVVHDRYFVRRFATGLWSIEGGTIRRYVDLDDLQRRLGK